MTRECRDRRWCENGRFGGAGGIRTPDLIIANDALSQLSYSPELRLVNPTTLEFPETELNSCRELFVVLGFGFGGRFGFGGGFLGYCGEGCLDLF